MLEITCYDNDGKKLDHLTQWDMGQIVSVNGATYVGSPVFHFCNRRSYRAYTVESTAQDDSISAKIPNALLKEPYPIEVYMYYQKEPGSAKTVYAFSIPVTPRKQPDDYIFTDNVDVISLIEIKKEMMAALEELRAAIQDSKDSIVQVTTVIDEARAATQEATSASASANAAAETAVQATTDARTTIQEAGRATEAATQAAATAGQAATSATNAAQSATDAANKANTAAGRVDTAIQDATTATGNANTAAESATTAAGKADASAGKADAATAKANDAATAATGASEKANAAATQATDAAKTATDAAATATSATSKAVAATTAANEASAKATQAATEAITAKNEATTAATTATEAAGMADTATQGANTAAEAANAAAKAANDAAEKAKIDVAGKLDKPTAAPKVNDVLKVESVNPDGSFNAVWSEPPATVVVDKTLQNAGQAADAAKTGEELKKLDKNKENVIVKSAFGKSVILDDPGEVPLASMKLFGRTEQETTTGKNLLRLDIESSQSLSGVTFLVNSDKSITINGTATSPVYLNIAKCELSAGVRYTLTGSTDGSPLKYALYLNNSNFTGENFNYDVPAEFEMTASGKFVVSIFVAAGASLRNITMLPMVRESSFSDPTYEPYTGGIPSPNPDYPQPLVSPGDDGNVAVSVTGKNLLDLSSGPERLSDDGVTYTKNPDGTFTRTGTATGTAGNIWMAGGYYTTPPDRSKVILILEPGVSYSIIDCALFSQKRLPSGKYDSVALIGDVRIDPEQYPDGYFVSGVRNLSFVAGTTYNDIVRPMVCLSSIQDKTYEPYTGGSITIPTPNGLPGIKVDSGGNYTDATGQQWICDEVDLERGVHIRRIGSKHLTGDESFSFYWDTNPNMVVCFDFLSDAVAVSGYSTIANITSTHTSYVATASGLAFVGDGVPGIAQGGETSLYMTLGRYTTEAEIQSYLKEQVKKGTPFTVYYQLAKPVETPLSPELIAAYRALHTNLPNTNILNDEGCEMLVSYFTDTEVGKYIGGLSRSSVRTDPATKSPVTLGYDDGGLYIMTE